MVWFLLGTWQVWSFGKGNITPEALAVDSEGVVHLVYQSLQGDLIHCWFDGGSWPSETLGTCTAPPVLRVGKQDKGLHVIAGSFLTYYYKSRGGSGWFKKNLGYNTSDYDLYVLNRPSIAFSTDRRIYAGTGDTLGNFTITIVDSSYVQYYPPDPPYYYKYSYSVGGPVSFYGSIIWYAIRENYYRYFTGEKSGPELAPHWCSSKYGDLEYEHFDYYDYPPCGDLVSQIATEGSYLVYYNYKKDFIRTYPMNDTIKGLFWGPDICRAGSYLLSAIMKTDRFPYLLRGTTYYSVDTMRSSSVSSIAATDTNHIFIAYVGSADSIVRIAYGSLPGVLEEPVHQRGSFLLGNIILNGPCRSEKYIRFTVGVRGFMDCRLYRSDGTRVRSVSKDVNCGDEISIPINELGSGVYYLWIRIAGYEKIFRVVLI